MKFLGTLLLIFITLKLCNVIAWSWWQVFIPLYIAAGFQVLAIIIIFVMAGFAERAKYKRK